MDKWARLGFAFLLACVGVVSARADGTTVQTPASSGVANKAIETTVLPWDRPGDPIATDREWAAVGAKGPSGDDSLFLYQLQGTTFVQHDYLTQAELGGAVGRIALSGQTFAVSVFDPQGVQTLRVYRFNGTDSVLEATLTTAALGVGVFWDVAISGSTLAVCGSGKVSVWTRTAGTWSQQQLVTLNPTLGDTELELDGNTFLVGGDSFSGKAGIYDRAGLVWTLSQILNESGCPQRMALEGDRAVLKNGNGWLVTYERVYGLWVNRDRILFFDIVQNIDLSGDQLVVYEQGHTQSDVLFFSFDGADWIWDDVITADGFTRTCAFVGQSVLADHNINGTLEMGVFTASGTDWSLDSSLPFTAVEFGGEFGHAVDFDGSHAVVGAPLGGLHSGGVPGPTTGLAAVYSFDGAGWVLDDVLAPPNGAEGDRFGFDVAIDDKHAVVGAPGPAGGSGTGRAFVFEDTGAGWEFVVELTEFGLSAGTFGHAVDIDRERIVIGAPDSSLPGAAFTFDLSAGVWQAGAALTAPSSFAGDLFGYAVSLDQAHLAVSALDRTVAVFADQGAGFVLEQSLQKPAGADDWGWSVDVDLPRIAIGAPNASPAPDSGLVAIFERQTNGVWVEEDTVFNSNLIQEHLGYGVELDGDLLVAGYFAGNLILGKPVGFWLFQRQGGGWTAQDMFDQGSSSLRAETVNLFDSKVAIGRTSFIGTNQPGGPGEVLVFDLDHQPATICWGDGSAGACPCGNDGAAGGGCSNSQTLGAQLASTGSTSLAAGYLDITAIDLPAQKPGLFFAGQQPTLGTLGDGLLCVVPQYRGTPQFSGPGGSFGTNDLGATLGASPGDAWTVQAWFRDPGGPCGSGMSTSSALIVTFTP